ncbi:hypothetical protein [uncultured Nitrosomonas sp.]|uniref:hypothetical protein n=1 Tax=uncultured Nitrosomonas sp. TaxID=156424 RepID=UPI0025EE5022|nr:hypothetical protein [uncultured Nitrosomonas sp.]
MNKPRDFLTALLCVLLVSILTTGCAIYETKIQAEPQHIIKNNLQQYFLPKGIISVKLERSAKDGVLVIESKVKIVADNHLEKYFFLKTNHNFLYDDENIIETDEEGLLISLNATSTFKGPEILAKAAEGFGYALKLSGPFMRTENIEPCEDDGNPFSIELQFDPYDQTSIENVNKEINTRCFMLEATAMKATAMGEILDQIDEDNKGILYRLRTSYEYKIFSIKTDEKTVEGKQFVVTIPDKDKIAIFNYDRGLFVTRKIMLEFKNGLLTKTTMTSPSELYGFMQLLVSPLTGVSEAIIGQFGVAADRAKAETTYITNKNELSDLKNPKTN